jgi:hypothetical protein
LGRKNAAGITGGRKRSAFGGLVALRIVVGIAILGSKLPGGEGNPGKQLAGIFRTADGVTAILGRKAVVQNGYNDLGIPLQANDGELTQSNKQPTAVSGEHQFLIKLILNTAGDGQYTGFLAGTIAHIFDPGGQYHRIQNFHHGGGAICSPLREFRRESAVTAEKVGTAVFTAEYRPFGKHSQTI